MNNRSKELGLSLGISMINGVLHKYAQMVVNPEIYNPLHKQYQSKLKSGIPTATASAPLPKVVPAITS